MHMGLYMLVPNDDNDDRNDDNADRNNDQTMTQHDWAMTCVTDHIGYDTYISLSGVMTWITDHIGDSCLLN